MRKVFKIKLLKEEKKVKEQEIVMMYFIIGYIGLNYELIELCIKKYEERKRKRAESEKKVKEIMERMFL
jgi:hypothetical protein